MFSSRVRARGHVPARRPRAVEPLEKQLTNLAAEKLRRDLRRGCRQQFLMVPRFRTNPKVGLGWP